MLQKGKVSQIVEYEKLNRGTKKAVTISYCESKDGIGYSENDVEVFFKEDGGLHFCSDPEHGQVYLYPEQVKLLKKLLK